MNSRITKQSSCDGKIGYATKSEASMAAASLGGKRKVKRPMNAYGCEFCGKHHIGNSRHSKKRKVIQPGKGDGNFGNVDFKSKPGGDKGFYLVRDNRFKS